MGIGKKIFALFLAALMIVNTVPFTAIAEDNSYHDVASTHWAHDVIAKWSGGGYNVLEGDGSGNFYPNKGVSLGELATILSKTFGYTERVAAEVTPDWADPYVERAMAAGVFEQAEKMDANLPVTREQAVKYIALAYHMEPVEGETDFLDNEDIGEAYKPYVNAFQNMGYLAGKPGNVFDPQAVYTRSEAMQLIENTTSEIVDQSVKGQNYAKNIILRKSGISIQDTSVKENLIIGQGVGDGEITLDRVTIGGLLMVCGGGSNSINVTGEKAIPFTTVNKPFGEKVHLKGEFGTVTVADGTNVILTGKVDQLILLGNAEATVNGATIRDVEINGGNVKLLVDKASKVETVTVSADNAVISGNGTVKNVNVTEKAKSGVEVLTVPTKIVVDAKAGAVKTRNDGMVQPGETLTTSGSSASGRDGGGGNNSNGGGSIPTPPPEDDTFQLFSVTDIMTGQNNSVMVETTASDQATLDVKILSDVTGISTDWESGNLLAKGKTTIEDSVEKEFINVEVSSSLPDYFVVVATLLNDRGDKLCEPYVFIENTKAYELYENKTTANFDSERVVNLDQDETNNFLVVAEDIPYIQSGENGANFLDASRSEEGIYIFTNANEIILGLKTGDRFVALDKDNMLYLIEVTSISHSGTTVTINGALEPDLGEFTEFVKIDMEDVALGEPEMDLSDAEEGVVLLDENDTSYDVVIDHSDDAPSLDDIIATPAPPTSGSVMQAEMKKEAQPRIDAGGSVSGSIKMGIKAEKKLVDKNGVTVKVNLGGSVKATSKISVKIVYDFVLFGADYFECKISAEVETKAQVKLSATGEIDVTSSFEIKLGKANFPTPIAGLTVEAEVSFPVQLEELSVSLLATATSKIEVGVRFGTVGFEPFLTKSTEADLKVEGKITITIGPKLAFGVDFVDCLEAKLTAQTGLEIEGVVELFDNPDLTTPTQDRVHACSSCLDGNLDFIIKAGIKYKASLFDIKGLKWEKEHTFATLKIHLAKFFVSIRNASDSIYGGRLKFGWNAECANYVLRTIIDPQDNGATVDSAAVMVKKENGDVVASDTGKITKMLYPGRYSASATDNHLNFMDKKFTVSNKSQTVVLPAVQIQPGQGILNGNVIDAETKTAIPSASIKVYSGSTLVESISADLLGNYTLILDAGSYQVDTSAPNYRSFTNYITVEDGRTHYLETSLLVTSAEGFGTASGMIRDAVNGQALSGVNLMVTNGWGNMNGTPITSGRTNGSGQYQFRLPYGNYTVIMSLDGYVTDSFNIVVKQSPFEKHATLSPIQNAGDYRVVLTWGASPRDLDSHLNADEGIHVYFYNMDSTNAWLDVDDTFSYGPETITITNLARLGGFKFSVHDYTNKFSGTTQLSSSGAVVRLYHGGELLRTYNVPNGKSGTVWNVFKMTADGRIIDLNSFEYQSDPGLVGSEDTTRTFVSDPTPLKDYELETEITDEAGYEDVIDETIEDETTEDETIEDETIEDETIEDETIEDETIEDETIEGETDDSKKDTTAGDHTLGSDGDTTEETVRNDEDNTSEDNELISVDTPVEKNDTTIEKELSNKDTKVDHEKEGIVDELENKNPELSPAA